MRDKEMAKRVRKEKEIEVMKAKKRGKGRES